MTSIEVMQHYNSNNNNNNSRGNSFHTNSNNSGSGGQRNNVNSKGLLYGLEFYLDGSIKDGKQIQQVIYFHGGRTVDYENTNSLLLCNWDGDKEENNPNNKKIVRVSYLNSCLEMGRPLDLSRLTRCTLSCCCDGMVIASSGQRHDVYEHLSNMLCARYLDELTKDVDILIASSSFNQKVFKARLLNIPVVTKDWILQCIEEKKKLGIEKYQLKVFEGCLIGLTGFQVSERRELNEKTEKHGGTFSANFSKTVTVLIAHPESSTSEKCQSARSWNVPITSIEWFYSSIERGYCLDYKDFPVRFTTPVLSGSSSTLPSQLPPQSTCASIDISSPIAITHQYTPMPRNIPPTTPPSMEPAPSSLPCSLPHQQSFTAKDMILYQQQQSQNNRQPNHRHDEIDDHETFIKPKLNFNNQNQNQNQIIIHQPQQTIISDSSSVTALRHLTFSVIGFPNDEVLRELIEKYALCVEFDSTPRSITNTQCTMDYLVVAHGKHINEVTRRQLGHTKIVSMEWFDDCVAANQIFDINEYFFYKPLPRQQFMKSLEVCLTGVAIGSPEHIFIKKIARILSLRIDGVLKKRTNYLIAKDLLDGCAKHKFAIEHNIPIVSIDWLADCARFGEIKSPIHYNVKPIQKNQLNQPKQQTKQPVQSIQSIVYNQPQQQQQNLNQSDPIHELFYGISIYLSKNLKSEQKTMFTCWIEEHGGCIAQDCFTSITHYLADHVDMDELQKLHDPKYKQVTPAWLNACFAQNRLCKEEDYQPLPPLPQDDDVQDKIIVQSFSKKRTQTSQGLFNATPTDPPKQQDIIDIMDLDKDFEEKEKELKEEEKEEKEEKVNEDEIMEELKLPLPAPPQSRLGALLNILNDALPPSQVESPHMFSVPTTLKKSIKSPTTNTTVGKKGLKRSQPSLKRSAIIDNPYEEEEEDLEEEDEWSNDQSATHFEEDENSQRVTYGDELSKRKKRNGQQSINNIITNNTNNNSKGPNGSISLSDILKGAAPKWLVFSAFTDANRLPQIVMDGASNLGFGLGNEIDRSTTHLITPVPKRSEKYMIACAAGLWILSPSYILDCVKQKSMLDEYAYEWTAERVPEEEQNTKAPQFGGAARKCRLAVAEKKRGLFSNAIIFVPTQATSLQPWINILKHGGAEITRDIKDPRLTYVLRNKSDNSQLQVPPEKFVTDSHLTECILKGIHLVLDFKK